MKRIIIIIIILTTLASQLGFMQHKANDILEEVSEKVKSYHTIIMDFDFILENKTENIKEEYVGKLYLKGEKYMLDLMDVMTFFDGKTCYSFLSDVNEVNISEPDDDDDNFMNPAKLFTIYEEDFHKKFVKETVENGKDVYSIDLFPKNEDKEFSKLNLKVDKSTYHIVFIQIFGKEGNNIIIRLTSMEANTPIEDSMFTFNASNHEGVEIIDMR